MPSASRDPPEETPADSSARGLGGWCRGLGGKMGEPWACEKDGGNMGLSLVWGIKGEALVMLVGVARSMI